MPVHVTIRLVQRFLLVKDTLARNSNNHSSKNIRATVITKLNFTLYIYIYILTTSVNQPSFTEIVGEERQKFEQNSVCAQNVCYFSCPR